MLVQAEHLCVKTRGVEDPCSDTVTCKLDGVFRQPDKRAEFIALCKGLTSN
ncbi:GTP cyclohydrolase I [Caballeronia sp. BR00000012568055]|uniref:GTP cyclohydrolase I n=1 Tax=Caballeronia sp. BR00000012568055 TaxID=2918761 RepID=UPI0034D473CD